MKKIKQKNTKPVGAGLVTAQNKGITLIALIITIIVMLILVGVTISVALDGGLFSKAKQAAQEAEKHTIYDQIVATMELENSGEINVTETYNAVNTILTAQGKKVRTKTNTATQIVLEVEGKNGTYTYTITDKKIVIGEAGNTEQELVVTYQIINDTKVALKVESGIDVDKTLIEFIEANFGSITLDESGWIAIAKELGGSTVTSKEEALSYINVNYFKLPETQSEEDTKASLVMAAADIKVNGKAYNMSTLGYLIDISEEGITTIEISFKETSGDLSTTVEIGKKEEPSLLVYDKNYRALLTDLGMPGYSLVYCFKKNPDIAIVALVPEDYTYLDHIPSYYTIDFDNNTFNIEANNDQLNVASGTIGEDGSTLTVLGNGETEVICKLEDESIFDLYNPTVSNITDENSIYYQFKNGMYMCEYGYFSIEINSERTLIGNGIEGTMSSASKPDNDNEITESLANQGLSLDEEGKIWYTNSEGQSIELTYVESF